MEVGPKLNKAFCTFIRHTRVGCVKNRKDFLFKIRYRVWDFKYFFLRYPEHNCQILNFRSFGNKLFYSFLGIPYAKPPLGVNRFSYSEPIEPWNGVFEADKHLPCLQVIYSE